MNCFFANSDTDNRGILDELAFMYPPNSASPFFTDEWTGGNYYTQAYPYGTNFISQHTSSQSEPFAMWDELNCGGWHTQVAIPLSSVDGEFKVASEPSTFDCRVTIEAWMGDSFGRATPVIHWINQTEEILSRNVTVEVEYLPGNSLEGVGSETATFTDFKHEYITVRWGSPHEPAGWLTTFREERPIGPLRVRLKVDGYENDWIDLDISDPKWYSWNALLIPTVDQQAPNATETYTELGLVPELSSTQLGLLYDWALMGKIEHFSNLTNWMDTTGDNVWDVADIVHNQMQGE